MNPILVAIDFSECSINALEHALSISEKSNSDVHMVWVRRPESAKEIGIDEQADIEDVVKGKFNELIKRFEKYECNIQFELLNGKIHKEVVRYAEEIDAFLILTGAHGASGFEELWLGSNANKIISSTVLPVITIREKVDISQNLEIIVLPIDSTPETRQKILFSSILAGYFNAEIHILGLYSNKTRKLAERVDKYVKQIAEYLEEDQIRCKVIHKDVDHITRDTIEYAKSVNANLIAIMTEQERSAGNLLLGPYAAQMVNHSPIPVLSIRPKPVLTEE